MKAIFMVAIACVLGAAAALAQGNTQPLPPATSGGVSAPGTSSKKPAAPPAQPTGTPARQGTGGAAPAGHSSAPPSNPTGGEQYQNPGATAPK